MRRLLIKLGLIKPLSSRVEDLLLQIELHNSQMQRMNDALSSSPLQRQLHFVTLRQRTAIHHLKNECAKWMQ